VFIKAAASLVAQSGNVVQIPGVSKEMSDAVDRALKMEDDPNKLRDIVKGLQALPQSAARDLLIAALNAKILQREAAIAKDAAEKKIKDIVNPAPPPAGTRTYTVRQNDNPSKVASSFVGDGNRWHELQNANPKYNFLKQFWAGMVLTLPAGWPDAPGAAAPAPGAMPPPPPAPGLPPPTPGAGPAPSGAGPTANPYVILANDGIGTKGPSKLAAVWTGNGNRWRELIPANPHKRLNAKGDNFATWYAGEVIQLPASWLSGAASPTAPSIPAPGAPIMPPNGVPQPQALPEPKSAVEIAAANMIQNIRATQAARGARGAIGKEDQNLVRKFQSAAGIGVDGKAGPGVMLAAARAGQSSLPAVLYWPAKTSASVSLLAQAVLDYRNALRALAVQARTGGMDSRAIELEQSAANEVAAADKRGPLTT